MSGPIALFDKSFLHGLNINEAVWFDHFFMANITPVFLTESLADLEKHVRDGRTPEQIVQNLADKTPQLSGGINTYHVNMCIANLLGQSIPMNGQIPVSSSMPVETNDSRIGFKLKKPPEMDALHRWQNGDFLAVERKYAKNWRRQIELINLDSVQNLYGEIFADMKKSRDLNDAKMNSEFAIKKISKNENLMKFALIHLNVPANLFDDIIKRWKISGCSFIGDYAPYASYVLQIQLFYRIGLVHRLFSTSRKQSTNMIDLAYLFYLPFCMIFISNDKFHLKCAPLFTRENQGVVNGIDLKKGLKVVDEYYDTFPTEAKEWGIMRFAPHPPVDCDNYVSKLWDNFLPGWRKRAGGLVTPAPKIDKELKGKTDGLIEAKPILETKSVHQKTHNPDFMVVERMVQKRRGKWWQIPKDYKEGRN